MLARKNRKIRKICETKAVPAFPLSVVFITLRMARYLPLSVGRTDTIQPLPEGDTMSCRIERFVIGEDFAVLCVSGQLREAECGHASRSREDSGWCGTIGPEDRSKELYRRCSGGLAFIETMPNRFGSRRERYRIVYSLDRDCSDNVEVKR